MFRRDEKLEIENEILIQKPSAEEEQKKEVIEKHLWNTPSKLWKPEKPRKLYWKAF